MENIKINFRSIFFKLTESNNKYFLKERKTLVFIYVLILLPLFAINGILNFICEKLEYMLTIRNTTITINTPPSNKQKKLIKKYLLKD